MFRVLYSIGISAFTLSIRIASLWNPKARLWVQGRKHASIPELPAKSKEIPRVWFHCASLGEFEQARPVIEGLKATWPKAQIIVTFFSPSGYEIRKGYALADAVLYLPADHPQTMRNWVQKIDADLMVLVKYEFWLHMLETLQQNQVPVLLIAGRFRSEQMFFKPWGSWPRNILKAFAKLHVQDAASESLIKGIGISNVNVSGDPRYDRVMQNAQAAEAIPLIEKWLNGRKTWVAGSTWAEDEAVLLPWMGSEALIIAPHEINESHLTSIERNAGTTVIRYSELQKHPDAVTEVLLIDNIGMLMKIYRMAQFAYVGGGFRTGLHNILEPAAFGIPVCFGPKHARFPEASDMLQHGAAAEVSDVQAFRVLREQWQKGELPQNSNREFVAQRSGATPLILNDIHALLHH